MTRNYLAILASLALLTACNKTPPVQLSYAQSSVSYCMGAVITPNKPTVTGTVASYSVSPALPAGLTLNPDGSISGTPSAVSPTKEYSISALGSDGKVLATQQVSIAVGGSISYATPFVYPLDSAVSSVPQNMGGALAHCTITPALPAGLTLDSATCAISGKPTVASRAVDYKVFAHGACFIDSVAINIAVIPRNVRASRVVRDQALPKRDRTKFSRENKASRF